MCHQGVTTKQRARCAVLTRAACARVGVRVILVDVVCVMLVLVARVDIHVEIRAVYVQFSYPFFCSGDVLFTPPRR